MAVNGSKVSLVTDLDGVMEEMVPHQVWMVRPQFTRKYPTQRMTMIAEVVDISSLNLAQMQMFEIS